MNKDQKNDDRMPEWGTPEFELIAERASRLPMSQLVELVVDIGGIAFGSKQTVIQAATKDELIDVLDEAHSKIAILEYLKQRNV